MGGLMARWDKRWEEGRSSVLRWRGPRVPTEVGCAIRLKEVGLQALSGQQGRGNFPRTLQPSQPATWETRAVGVALRSVTEKSGSDPWPSSLSSFLVYRTSLVLSPPDPDPKPGLYYAPGHRG